MSAPQDVPPARLHGDPPTLALHRPGDTLPPTTPPSASPQAPNGTPGTLRSPDGPPHPPPPLTAAGARVNPLPPTGPLKRKNAATLHLCAAAYLDRRFRDRVIDHVYRRPDRAVAPNPGTDAVPILRHVLRSRAIDAAQQTVLAGLLLVLVFTSEYSKLELVIVLLLWAFVGQLVAVGTASSHPLRSARQGRAVRRLVIGVVVTAAVVGAWFYLARAFPEQVGFEVGFEEYRSQGMLHEAGYACVGFGELYDPLFVDCAGYGSEFGFVPGFTGAVVWSAVLGALSALFGALRGRLLATIPAELEPMRPANRRVHYIGESQRSTVVVYQAGRQPFAGSGPTLETWNFAMALRPAAGPAGGEAAMSIDPLSLNAHIRDRLNRLAADSSSARRLPSLAVSDHLYVSDRELADLARYPYELVRSGYPFQTVEQFQQDPTTPVRHHLRCEAASWDGELVTSVFVHFALEGESLYLEFTGCVLSPTRREYQVFGYRARSKRAMTLLGLARGAAVMPVALLRSPIDTIRNLVQAVEAIVRNSGRRKPKAGDNGAFYGIRELGAGAFEQNHFQGRDAVKYMKILERQILDALTEYLRERNVDTSELEERVTAIVNNGVVNYGELNAGAIGKGANANVGSIGRGARGTASGG
ncbi:hypothetical protein [Glycomyces algeriensis]|uniref:Uncharacterized protein n=1 Tax=Glycomyces algeriensis TaxID=256037 RepID=A0A9W6GD03_9ACTN|nr:hypothetical protein [Glycomyces algeriensis]MDA1368280.1 hypothetical protein [Glycomyces algeriensis]MDR7351920.1 hypothetical protein [Glycomyces algeriensis]GLI44651.1 hypothetical protein GALLR39Z86_45010 [Glycomyces algeriensis]